MQCIRTPYWIAHLPRPLLEDKDEAMTPDIAFTLLRYKICHVARWWILQLKN